MSLKNNKLQEIQFPEQSERRKKIDCFRQNDLVNSHYVENATTIFGQREGESLQGDSKCNVRNSLAWDSAFFTSPGVLDPEELFGGLNFRDMEIGIGLPEPEIKNRISDCSVRKSIAWDQAFFTSAGVLDPEELSLVNQGFLKSEMHQLPVIKEELHRSAELNSTAESSDLSLSSLELDLFDDIRASLNKNRKASSVAALASKVRIVTGNQNIHSLKKLDTSSRTGMRPAPSLGRQGMNTLGSQKIKKGANISPRKQVSLNRVSQSGDANSVSAPKPRITSGGISPLAKASTKGASLGPNHVKMGSEASKDVCVTGQQMTLLKKPCFGDSCRASPPFTRSPKPNESARFVFTSSDSGNKSAPKSLRRKIDTRLATSSLVSGIPLRKSVGERTKLVNSSCSTHLLSTPKSSHTSPASSIDTQRSQSSAVSLDITPSKGVCFDVEASLALDSDTHFIKTPSSGHECQEREMLNHDVKISMIASPVPNNNSSNIKPSCLRMPSPKIGFFDAENNLMLSPNGGLGFHSGVQDASKIGSGISKVSGASTRTRHGKLRSSGTSGKTGNVKLGSQQARSPRPPSDTVCADSKSKTRTEDEGTKRSMRKKMSRICDEQVFQRAKKLSSVKHEDINKHRPQNDQHICQEYDRENISGFKDQINDLSRHIKAIDLGKD